MEIKSEHHLQTCHDFTMEKNCIREKYHGKVFEGNECSKLMGKIDSCEKTILSGLPGVAHHLKAIKNLNTVRIKVFGNNLVSGWKKSLQDFEFSHKKIPDITKPLKVHVLTAHVSEFNEQYGKSKSLGFYSEQTG